MTQNFALIWQIRDFGSGQILQPRQFRLSPGLAKIAPCFPSYGLRKTVMKATNPADGLRSTQHQKRLLLPGR